MQAKVMTVICIPGGWQDQSDVVTSIVKKSQGYIFAGMVLMHLETKEFAQLEVSPHDPRMEAAFSAASGDRMAAQELARIGGHSTVIYLSGDGGSPDQARTLMKAANGVLRSDGLGVKIESAGKSHTAAEWEQLCQDCSLLDLYSAFVALAGEDESYCSCGMHNLGLPDATLEGDVGPDEVGFVLSWFNKYLLLESPTIKSGQTFCAEKGAPLYRLSHEPCTKFPEDHLFHNPFGVWKLRAA
jgi:hypothetical protein